MTLMTCRSDGRHSNGSQRCQGHRCRELPLPQQDEDEGEHENWNNIQTTIGELHSGVVRRGAAFNASLFRGGYRNAENAFGGDTIVIDEDEGIDPEVIKQLPVFQELEQPSGPALVRALSPKSLVWMDVLSPGCCSRWDVSSRRRSPRQQQDLSVYRCTPSGLLAANTSMTASPRSWASRPSKTCAVRPLVS